MKRKLAINISLVLAVVLISSACQFSQAVQGLLSSDTPTVTATYTPTVTLTSTATTTATETLAPTATETPAPTATYTLVPPKPIVPTAVSGESDVCNGGDTAIEAAVLGIVNKERANAGLSALSSSGALTSSARNHSTDMATNNFFSHTGSNGSSPFDRILANGFSYSAAGENIYAGDGSNNKAGAAVVAWMASPSHKDNLLNASFTHAGVGYWCNASSEYHGYFTIDLAKP